MAMMNCDNLQNRLAWRTLPAALFASGVLSLPAEAAQVAPPAYQPAEEWQFTLSPYLWAAGIRGDVGHRSTGTQFMKTDFSAIARDLDVAVMGMGEARKGPYSLLMDLMFIDTTTRNGLPDGAPASRLKVDSRTVSGFLGGGYTLLEEGGARLDATGGVRVWYSSTSLHFQGGIIDGASGSDRATWVDGVAGLRGQYALTPTVRLSAWGLAGGGQSRLDWDAAALLSWEFTPGFSAVAGYRAMGVDYRHNGFVYDVVQQGPILGMNGRF
ncbi:hypothetical protein HL670_01813 [Serratia plymuthica]|uniref:Porin n=2 Tax=Serratia TaxID=613 RepID=S4YPA2_SERPL|nr:hypothetical protein M621_15965 [Serratia plymuthica S13]ANJ95179.1 hypothetical protein ADP72_20285 [Serratia plymuthica]KYG13867.1 hypothetical protein SOD10_48910 [Serratia plymuthica]MBI6139792.1 hypothetical protein [Serratia plymuthica]NIC26431.1 hypothetical protein [Serratia plymuthica]